MRHVATEIATRWTTTEDQLYRKYSGQSRPQPAHIALDLETGTLSASYNPESLDSRPIDVHLGRTLWFGLGVIPTGSAADELLEAATDLAADVLAGASIVWDGNNNVGRLDEDATEAASKLHELIDEWDFGTDFYRDED